MLKKYSDFQTDVLPGGTESLRYLTGQATPGENPEEAADMDLPSDDKTNEEIFSYLEDVRRRAPNGHATFILAPRLCVNNGVFDELNGNLRIAEALVRHGWRSAGSLLETARARNAAIADQHAAEVERLAEEHAAAEIRRAATAAQRERRMAGGGVAMTDAHLDSMRQPDSPYVTLAPPGARPYSLADNCALMIERVKAVCSAEGGSAGAGGRGAGWRRQMARRRRHKARCQEPRR